MLLALDTSTSAVAVALLDLDGGLLAQEHVVDPRGTTELLAPLVQRALGPFTSLRVGIVTARTFALARSVPVLGVPSHDAIAHEWYLAGGRGPLLVATDARRKEVYASVYAQAAGDESALPWQLTRGPLVSRAVDLPEGERVLPTAGRGPSLYPEALANADGPLDVSAAALGGVALARHRLGLDQPTDPLYLRRPDATPSVPRSAIGAGATQQ